MAKVKIDKLVHDTVSCIGAPYPPVGGGSTNLAAIQAGAEVDCSGLIVACFAAQGVTIAHGSNTIWRKYLLPQKGELTAGTVLRVGMAVFKHKESGDEPDQYKKDGQGDFSHIGIVCAVNPVQIVHASTNGMQVRLDTKRNGDGWTYYGYFRDVDYDSVGGDPAMTQAKVTGGRLKVRQTPGGKTAYSLPDGAVVSVLSVSGEWSEVELDDIHGWAMSKYLVSANTAPESGAAPTLEERVAALERAVFGNERNN